MCLYCGIDADLAIALQLEESSLFLSVHRLQIYQELREELAKVKTLSGMAEVNRQLKQRCQVGTLQLPSSFQFVDVMQDSLVA